MWRSLRVERRQHVEAGRVEPEVAERLLVELRNVARDLCDSQGDAEVVPVEVWPGAYARLLQQLDAIADRDHVPYLTRYLVSR